MSGLRVLGIAAVIGLVAWVAWLFLSAPQVRYIIFVDERNPNPIERVDIAVADGKIQSVDVIFGNGTDIYCCNMVPGYNETNGSDGPNATKAPDR